MVVGMVNIIFSILITLTLISLVCFAAYQIEHPEKSKIEKIVEYIKECKDD